ncbi:hypothetical protein MYSEV_013 [Mythimna separata entomopoxvirus 'L']|uniref:C2H2-type domain-containing protein n=1 Tax=Mythimna separata entomopoxvirus 'L' TaxID=1293572 RepID=A0A916KQB4_9POXV|nr:hypothetical protein MYSEV_013 [Mythimna separata entomopoxvirus 'L']CCU56211.1 hypothetical protein MYSEV_013 [Mythimna separata entomopoxvirus 'L']
MLILCIIKKCDICGFLANDRKKMEFHYFAKHKKDSIILIFDYSYKYDDCICKICEFKAFNKQGLKCHYRAIHRSKLILVPVKIFLYNCI